MNPLQTHQHTYNTASLLYTTSCAMCYRTYYGADTHGPSGRFLGSQQIQ